MSVHKWLVGLFLAVLMVGALLVNSMLFSARSFQANLASIAPETSGVLSVERLADAEERIEAVRDGVSLQRAELSQLRQSQAALEADLQARRDAAAALQSEVTAAIAQVENRNSISDAQPAAMLGPDDVAPRLNRLASQSLPAEETPVIQAARAQTDTLNRTLDDIDALETQRREILQRQSVLGGQVADADRQVFAIQQGVVSNYEQYDRIRSEALSLMNSSPFGVGAGLVQVHPTFMSTVLVLLMGLLGAILYLFPAYMSRATPVTFAEIAVRSIFGMVTALAFYIVANASVAGLAFIPGGQQADMATAMNPFTVSLIGIVAGIMADDIARWIQRRGSELLGGTPGTPAAPPAAATGLAHTADAGPGAGVNPHGGPYDPSVG